MTEAETKDVNDQLIELATKWRHDPYGFVMGAFPWGEKGPLEHKKGPRKWQAEILKEVGQMLRENENMGVDRVIREAVASGHGIGKSCLIAWLILWAMSTFEDCKGGVTAGTETQLRTKTWPELKKWFRICLFEPWFDFQATSLHSKDPIHRETWRIDLLTWSETNSDAFAGLHNEGKREIVIYDEASSIADKIWEVTEGAMTDANTEILWIAFGNPTQATGRFRECFRRFKKRWITRNIDSRTVEGINHDEFNQWVEDYGEDSDFVKVRVRGLFPSQSILQFISDELVDGAMGRHLDPHQYDWAPKILTLDNAYTGDDDLVIGLRQGLMFRILKVLKRNTNDQEVGAYLAGLDDHHNAAAVFIDSGYGTGVHSYGVTMGREHWKLVWFAGQSADPGCFNKRAEMYKKARDHLRDGASIPKRDDLRMDLITPEAIIRNDGKIQIESKKEIKKRVGRSPGLGDAYIMSFAFPVAPRSVREAFDRQRTAMAETEWDPIHTSSRVDVMLDEDGYVIHKYN